MIAPITRFHLRCCERMCHEVGVHVMRVSPTAKYPQVSCALCISMRSINPVVGLNPARRGRWGEVVR